MIRLAALVKEILGDVRSSDLTAKLMEIAFSWFDSERVYDRLRNQIKLSFEKSHPGETLTDDELESASNFILKQIVENIDISPTSEQKVLQNLEALESGSDLDEESALAPIVEEAFGAYPHYTRLRGIFDVSLDDIMAKFNPEAMRWASIAKRIASQS